MTFIYIFVVLINQFNALVIFQTLKFTEKFFEHRYSKFHWCILIVIVEIVIFINTAFFKIV